MNMTPNHNLELISQICQLGFTQLESEIYLHLLFNGENTGYAVAKGIGKAVANVYKGIDGLTRKGAVEVSIGDSKICHAVPWKRVLKSEQTRFAKNIDSLTESFEQLPEPQDNESVYQITNTSQLLQAGQILIEQSQSIVVAELEPMAAEHFAPMLQAAAERGVEVRVKVYRPIEIKHTHITLRKNGEQVFASTQDVSFKLCADGRESLIAALSSDFSSVIQAFKTKSALVSMDIYCGIIYELILTELKQAIPKGDIKRCQAILDETEHLHPFSTKNSVFKEYQSRYQL